MLSQIWMRRVGLLIALVALLGLVACGAKPASTALPQPGPTSPGGTFDSPLPTPVVLGPLTLEAGMGGVKGQVVSSPSEWQGQPITVFFAAYYEGGEGQGGFFMLEPSQAPSTFTDAAGAFQSGTIPPRKYVVVIGPDAEKAMAVQEDGAPKVFEVVAGEVLDLGRVSLP